MQSLPPSFRPNLLILLKDYIHRVIKGELHLPPWWLRDVGGSDFEATGQEFLNRFIQIGGLQSDERVLEIGCGSGRIALPLTRYLDRPGVYVGMDITRPSIIWCQRNISRRYTNFYFLHVDLYNKRYNPSGRYKAQNYPFPFRDESFDFIFLTSVFTHLLPEDIAHYLPEIARMLHYKGRIFLTLFLLNDKQRLLAEQQKNDIDFNFGSGPYRLRNPEIPESAIAYNESYFLNLLAEYSLTVKRPIYYGTWSGRNDGLSYQDILLVQHKEQSL